MTTNTHPAVITDNGVTWKTDANGLPTHIFDEATATWKEIR